MGDSSNSDIFDQSVNRAVLRIAKKQSLDMRRELQAVIDNEEQFPGHPAFTRTFNNLLDEVRDLRELNATGKGG